MSPLNIERLADDPRTGWGPTSPSVGVTHLRPGAAVTFSLDPAG